MTTTPYDSTPHEASKVPSPSDSPPAAVPCTPVPHCTQHDVRPTESHKTSPCTPPPITRTTCTSYPQPHPYSHLNDTVLIPLQCHFLDTVTPLLLAARAASAGHASAGRTPTASPEAIVRLLPLLLFSVRSEDSADDIFTTTEAALANPNTTRSGRKHAKHELKAMVRSLTRPVPVASSGPLQTGQR